ncbi:hypothetical protein [Novosphingobium terrae]|uniref:hypothetical protein n=1 Tax=Novosphingobium terrae TaxID=2726189 RepID=UPI00197FE67D|nr:hypothetical protein [Novosphingobium terrae]
MEVQGDADAILHEISSPCTKRIGWIDWLLSVVWLQQDHFKDLVYEEDGLEGCWIDDFPYIGKINFI